ncbi:DUF3987 domain-containing protein (plasmid) [Alicyclobacillus curvatus]|nr:DUF3987 domain-containing protein [Alicyclobacillus curvatus]
MSEVTEQLSRASFAGIVEKKPIAVKAPPLDVLPRDLREFIQVGADSLNCPTDFLFMPLLTTAGAAIGGARAGVPKPGWREYPVLWTGIIGSPAAGKSPALNLITSPIKDEQMRLVEEYNREMAEYREDLQEWSKNKKKDEKPDEPTQKLAFTTDCTTETLRDLLKERPNGVMLFQDELAGWIRGFNQYKTSGNDRQTWLSIWSAETVAAARKTSRVVLKHPLSLFWVGYSRMCCLF